MRIAAIRTSQTVELENPDAWVDWMLRNYRRWHYSGEAAGPETPKHCVSVEHQYVARYGEDADESADPEATTEPVDERAGELMDRLVLAMPAAQRDVLRLHYVKWPTWRVRSLLVEGGRADHSIEAADAWRARKWAGPLSAYLDHLLNARRRIARDLHNNVMTMIGSRP